MEGDHIQTVVRVPVESVARELVETHAIRLALESVTVEGDFLVFSFGSPDPRVGPGGPPGGPRIQSREDQASPTEGALGELADQLKSGEPPVRHVPRAVKSGKRRRSGQRNRMRTRGWNVVTKAQNSHGQTVTIYEPFVVALKGGPTARRDRERLVRDILKGNGNDPGPESIRYYLDNTLEYLAKGEA
jgi:hypothetical protein